MKNIKRFLFLFLSLFLIGSISFSQQNPSSIEIGIDEKQGQYIPMDLQFIDETGNPVTLQDLVGNKPFILSLVYYECPSICGPLLNGIAEVLDRMDLEPGKDFVVITLSFDPKENYKLASGKKNSFYNAMTRVIPQDGWRFLTGSEENIRKITDIIGYRYQEQEDGTFAHPSAIMAVSPKGMVTRYLYGINYLPFDMKMALVEASNGKVGPTINKLLRYCFSYQPQGRKYTFNILRVSAITTTLFGLGFMGFLVVKTRKMRSSLNTENTEGKKDA